FEPALLPSGLRDWVLDEAERMPCPPDFVAAAVMVALGSVIGARCAVQPKAHDDWLVVPNLWGGIVGLPSAKKSPEISAAMRPVERLIARAMETHRKALEDFESAKAVFEARRDAATANLKAAARKPGGTALSARADELRALKGAAPEEPSL